MRARLESCTAIVGTPPAETLSWNVTSVTSYPPAMANIQSKSSLVA